MSSCSRTGNRKTVAARDWGGARACRPGISTVGCFGAGSAGTARCASSGRWGGIGLRTGRSARGHRRRRDCLSRRGPARAGRPRIGRCPRLHGGPRPSCAKTPLRPLASVHRQLLVRQVVGMRKVHSERGCLVVSTQQSTRFKTGTSSAGCPTRSPMRYRRPRSRCRPPTPCRRCGSW
jgi:hypothetical protein